MLVDSHCHLSIEKNSTVATPTETEPKIEPADLVAAIVHRARCAGVEYLLNIGTDLSEIDQLKSTAERHEGVFYTVGVHPANAAEHLLRHSPAEISATIDEAIGSSKCVGIGEIGLDYHYTRDDEKGQKELFELQMEIARKHLLPISIHSRDSATDTIAILRHHAGVPGVMHCFSGDREFAFSALDLGFYISFSGVITFKNSRQLQEIVKIIPADRLLVETDAPFLSPEPLRGKINEPAFLIHTAQKMAALREASYEEISTTTCQNFFHLFSRATLCLEKTKKNCSGCMVNTP
jgi:TatD DNase family protein